MKSYCEVSEIGGAVYQELSNTLSLDLFLNLDLMVTRNQEVSLKLSTLCDMVQENILGAMFSFSSDNEKEEVSKREREWFSICFKPFG